MDTSPSSALIADAVVGEDPAAFELPLASTPLFIGLLAAAQRARLQGGVLANMLFMHQPALEELERVAGTDEHALDLCGRLLGLVLDAETGGDLHALVRLRRGLRLAVAFLQLRSAGPVQVVARLKSGDPDLRAELAGRWVDIDLRPRRAAVSATRLRLRLGQDQARFESAAVA
jgi:hypothetical protein